MSGDPVFGTAMWPLCTALRESVDGMLNFKQSAGTEGGMAVIYAEGMVVQHAMLGAIEVVPKKLHLKM